MFRGQTLLAKMLDVPFHIDPTDLANLLAERPAPHGVAGGAGGGPPCKSKNTTFKIFKKKGNYYFCSLLVLTFMNSG